MPTLVVSLPLDTANKICEGARAEARRLGLAPVVVAVLDAAGQLVAYQREDGASLLRFEIAFGKAYGALGLGLSSREIGARNAERQGFVTAVVGASGGRLVPVAGGVLVLDAKGAAIGAVGISGDTSDHDEAAAIAGIRVAGHGSDPAAAVA